MAKKVRDSIVDVNRAYTNKESVRAIGMDIQAILQTLGKSKKIEWGFLEMMTILNIVLYILIQQNNDDIIKKWWY